MSGLVAAATTIFTSVTAPAAGGGFLAGVLGTAVKGAFMGGVVSAITGGDVGKGMLGGALGGAVLGGLGGLGETGLGQAIGLGKAADGAVKAGGGLFGDGWLGKTLSGGASAYMDAAGKQKEFEMEGRLLEDKEERAMDRYSGVGSALLNYRRPQEPLGLGGRAPQMADQRAQERGVLSAGDEYQRSLQLKSPLTRRTRLRFNPDTLRIEEEGVR